MNSYNRKIDDQHSELREEYSSLLRDELWQVKDIKLRKYNFEAQNHYSQISFFYKFYFEECMPKLK